jgi:hypothetical protein
MASLYGFQQIEITIDHIQGARRRGKTRTATLTEQQVRNLEAGHAKQASASLRRYCALSRSRTLKSSGFGSN